MLTLPALSPFGPIFAKELRVAARRKRTYLLRVAYLGILLLFLLMTYGITRDVHGPSGVAARAQQQESLGWAFFMCFSMFSVCAMAAVGAIVTSTAINGERLHKTLHVLLMTPITAWQIAAGKLFSRLLTALTLIALSLPVLALVRLLGGVEIGQMAGVLCLCIAMAMTSAAIGLFYSAVMNRTYAVILISYLTMGILYLFVPMILSILMSVMASAGPAGPWRMWMAKIITTINPFFCTGMLATGQMRMLPGGWWPCVLIHLGATALLLLLTALLLRRIARREGEGTVSVGATASAGATGSLPASALPPPPLPADGTPPALPILPPPLPVSSSPQARRLRSVGNNPVLWREWRRPMMSRRWQRLAAALGAVSLLLITYLTLYAGDALDEREIQIGFAYVFHAVLMLVVCVLAGTVIAQEKESDTWTLLLATPISAGAVVWGKTAGVLRRTFWPTVLVALHFFIFAVAEVISWSAFAVVMWVIVTFNALWVATGVYLSLTFKKVTTAVIVNLLLPVALYGLVSLVLGVIEAMTDGSGDLIDQVTWYMPYFYLIMAIDRLETSGASQVCMPMWGNDRVPAETFINVAMAVGVAHLVAAAALLTITAKVFNRLVGRAAQRGPADGIGHVR